MEKITKYVERFFATRKKNIRFGIKTDECADFVREVRKANFSDAFSMASKLFSYGYAKGYRAALAEMKKGGATV